MPLNADALDAVCFKQRGTPFCVSVSGGCEEWSRGVVGGGAICAADGSSDPERMTKKLISHPEKPTTDVSDKATVGVEPV